MASRFSHGEKENDARQSDRCEIIVQNLRQQRTIRNALFIPQTDRYLRLCNCPDVVVVVCRDCRDTFMTRINRDLEYADVYSKLTPQARRYVLTCANNTRKAMIGTLMPLLIGVLGGGSRDAD